MGNQELKNSREQNEKGGVRTLRNQGNGCVNEERTPSPKLPSFDLLVCSPEVCVPGTGG